MKIEEGNGKFAITDFNEIEAYKIASKIERDGIEFYGKLIGGIKDENIKKGLKFLLEEEKRHLNFFQESLTATKETKEDGFEEEDLLDYMNYGIFEALKKINQISKGIGNIRDAIQLGIDAEENSIMFYQACLNYVKSSTAKEELNKIADEERRHKILLTNVIAALK